jgi:hypothetical protein
MGSSRSSPRCKANYLPVGVATPNPEPPIRESSKIGPFPRGASARASRLAISTARVIFSSQRELTGIHSM